MQVERWLRRFGVVLIAALAIRWSAPASAQTPTQRGATVTRRVIDRGAARRSIYLENQYLDVPAIIERIEAALTRSVEVVAVVPAEPIGALVSRARAALGQHENCLSAMQPVACRISDAAPDWRKRASTNRQSETRSEALGVERIVAALRDALEPASECFDAAGAMRPLR